MRIIDIRRKTARELIISSSLNVDISRLGSIKQARILILEKDYEVLIINNFPLIVFKKDHSIFFPYIESCNFFDSPDVTVDRGALPYILRGADVMAPGIISFSKFKTDDIVFVKCEGVPRVVAIAKALVDSEQLSNMKKGKVLENLHYVGDKIWKQVQKIFHK